MPFHVSGHKPGVVKKFRFSLKNRLQVAALGSLLIFGGIYKFSHGTFIETDWLHQPVYSTSLVAIGAAVILSALIPSRWIETLANRIASNEHKRRLS